MIRRFVQRHDSGRGHDIQYCSVVSKLVLLHSKYIAICSVVSIIQCNGLLTVSSACLSTLQSGYQPIKVRRYEGVRIVDVIVGQEDAAYTEVAQILGQRCIRS